MSLSDLTRRSQRVDQIVAIDLGTRTTKAVWIEREPNGFTLRGYAMQDAPVYEKDISPYLLTEHLKQVIAATGTKTKKVVLALGLGDSVISHAEMPPVSPGDMRKMVTLNPRNYFQQDLKDHSFDCISTNGPVGAGQRDPTPQRVLIGAARQQTVRDLVDASKSAGLTVQTITLGQVGPRNAFVASSDTFKGKVIALVDIGFTNSSITILDNGEIILTRIANVGSDKLTSGLADALNITYPVAEGLKLIMPDKVQSKLQTLMAPLGRELRASIDYLEHQLEKTVSEVYVSGGSARSDSILKILQSELMLPCHRWDSLVGLNVAVPAASSKDLLQDAPQLSVAIGAALAVLDDRAICLDLLAGERQQADERRRDPVKKAYLVAAAVMVAVFGWAMYMPSRLQTEENRLANEIRQLTELQIDAAEVGRDSSTAGRIETSIANLNYLSTNRLLWSQALYALQHTVVQDIQIVRLRTDQLLQISPGVPATTNGTLVVPAIPPYTTEKTQISIQAKDFADPPAAEKFMQRIATHPWFKSQLRKSEPIRLRDRLARQADPEAGRNFVIFTIECYSEKTF